MAIIQEVHEPDQPSPRYTGPSKPVLKTRPNPGAPLTAADPMGSVQLVLSDRQHLGKLALVLLLGEAVLCALIIKFVGYTEIDWSTYMQQVRCFVAGERDYSQIHGDTGPLVYPAGFLWVYTGLYYLTNHGRSILAAQSIFAAIYLATSALVFVIHSRCRSVPPYALILLTLSRRLHSIYVLRMFNDGVGMLFLYGAVVAWTAKRPKWNVGCLLFSLALSIKMNFLLYLPGLCYLLYTSLGPIPSLLPLSLIALPQLVLAAPFLSSADSALTYFRTAFNFQREFLWEWTVNWRWLGEEAFSKKEVAGGLLLGHAVGLVLLAFSWAEAEGGLGEVLWRGVKKPMQSAGRGRPSPDRIVMILFTSNVLGIVFARSLHYQFYAWYAHQVVFLLWQAPFEIVQRVAILGGIEWAWNVFPSTQRSSLTVTVANLALVVAAVTGGNGGGFVAVAPEKAGAVGDRKEKAE